MKIGVEIVYHQLLRRVSGRGLHPIVRVVDAPEIERQPLCDRIKHIAYNATASNLRFEAAPQLGCH
jgi:hypothetical protein